MPDQRRWTIFVCAEPDGQDCASGTHRYILRHKCAAIRRFHDGGSGPKITAIEVMPILEIDDEMCDRAIRALHPGLPGEPAQSERDWIRPALEAAING